jgi:hypothetical protein
VIVEVPGAPLPVPASAAVIDTTKAQRDGEEDPMDFIGLSECRTVATTTDEDPTTTAVTHKHDAPERNDDEAAVIIDTTTDAIV